MAKEAELLVAAIKSYRARTGASLLRSKEAVVFAVKKTPKLAKLYPHYLKAGV